MKAAAASPRQSERSAATRKWHAGDAVVGDSLYNLGNLSSPVRCGFTRLCAVA
jgi:hypothetical protein